MPRQSLQCVLQHDFSIFTIRQLLYAKHSGLLVQIGRLVVTLRGLSPRFVKSYKLVEPLLFAIGFSQR